MRPFDLRIIKVLSLGQMVCIYRSLLQKMFEISHGNESGGDKNQQLHKAGFNDECLYSGK